jgi:hypothetical protein
VRTKSALKRTRQRPSVCVERHDCQAPTSPAGVRLCWHAPSAPGVFLNRAFLVPSCGPFQGYHGQVPSFTLKGDLTCQSDTRLAFDQGHRCRAGRPSRPIRPWFEPRLTVLGREARVHFLGRSAVERHVRAMAVVPCRQGSKLTQKRPSAERHQRQPCDTLLEGQDQSLDHGDTAGLADRAEPGTDALPPAPRFESLAGELGGPGQKPDVWALLLPWRSRDRGRHAPPEKSALAGRE